MDKNNIITSIVRATFVRTRRAGCLLANIKKKNCTILRLSRGRKGGGAGLFLWCFHRRHRREFPLTSLSLSLSLSLIRLFLISDIRPSVKSLITYKDKLLFLLHPQCKQSYLKYMRTLRTTFRNCGPKSNTHCIARYARTSMSCMQFGTNWKRPTWPRLDVAPLPTSAIIDMNGMNISVLHAAAAAIDWSVLGIQWWKTVLYHYIPRGGKWEGII